MTLTALLQAAAPKTAIDAKRVFTGRRRKRGSGPRFARIWNGGTFETVIDDNVVASQ